MMVKFKTSFSGYMERKYIIELLVVLCETSNVYTLEIVQENYSKESTAACTHLLTKTK